MYIVIKYEFLAYTIYASCTFAQYYTAVLLKSIVNSGHVHVSIMMAQMHCNICLPGRTFIGVTVIYNHLCTLKSILYRILGKKEIETKF